MTRRNRSAQYSTVVSNLGDDDPEPNPQPRREQLLGGTGPQADEKRNRVHGVKWAERHTLHLPDLCEGGIAGRCVDFKADRRDGNYNPPDGQEVGSPR